MAVIETQTFRLAPGADVDGFLEADVRLQTELMLRKPTFLRRTTARSGGGDWLIVLLWASRTDADAAWARFGDNPARATFMAFVDDATLRTSWYETLE